MNVKEAQNEELVRLWGLGYTPKEIAAKLGIKPNQASQAAVRLRKLGFDLPKRRPDTKAHRRPVDTDIRPEFTFIDPALRNAQTKRRLHVSDPHYLKRGEDFLHMSTLSLTKSRRLAWKGSQAQASRIIKTSAIDGLSPRRVTRIAEGKA